LHGVGIWRIRAALARRRVTVSATPPRCNIAAGSGWRKWAIFAHLRHIRALFKRAIAFVNCPP
jgi:hypothetical protein